MVGKTVAGGHYGIIGWLAQRVTAAFMAAFLVFFAAMLAFHRPDSYVQWRALIAHEWMRIGLLLFFYGLFFHAWIGMRDILMDYVHSTGIRLLLQVFIILMLCAYAIWAAHILWGA